MPYACASKLAHMVVQTHNRPSIDTTHHQCCKSKHHQKACVRSYMPSNGMRASAEADVAEFHQSFSCECIVQCIPDECRTSACPCIQAQYQAVQPINQLSGMLTSSGIAGILMSWLGVPAVSSICSQTNLLLCFDAARPTIQMLPQGSKCNM